MNTNRTKAAVIGGTLAGGVTLALLSPSSPAMAFDSGGLHLALTVQSPATLVARGAAVDVPVEVNCNATSAYVDVQLTERVGSRLASGYGYVEVACTGSPQRVLVRVVASGDKAFTRGTALANANIGGCNATICGGERSSVTIKITK
ncbi:hypothetical protein [Jatrophihabitans sp.]|jgi:hypothetical protein|uniref:hypothetical protein n=1 Tax=Jatrophihabitans sp. TaxID=1932789 RepID=UPI002F032BF5